MPAMPYTFSGAFLVARRDSTSQDAVCLSVCGIFFLINPYLQAGLTDLDEIWHDGRS